MKSTSNADQYTIAVIGRSFHPDGKETAALLASSLEPFLLERGAQVLPIMLKDLVFDISNEAVHIFDAVSGKDLAEMDAVLMTNWFSHVSIRKDMALAIARYLERKDVPYMNTEAGHSRSTSKLSQMIIAAYESVCIPRTVFSLSLSHTIEYMKKVGFKTPFIFKDAQASRGNGNYKLDSINAILEHTEEHSEKTPFIAQELIESDGSDYRFFIVGGKTQLVIHRIGSGNSHLNNTSAGATTELVSPDDMSDEANAIATTMSRALHRELTGLDVMIDSRTDMPYFLEANPIPQIATGSNVDTKLKALADTLVIMSRHKGEKL